MKRRDYIDAVLRKPLAETFQNGDFSWTEIFLKLSLAKSKVGGILHPL